MVKTFGSGLVWSFIYFVLLLSLYTPLNVLTLSFLMVPAVVMAVKLDPVRFWIHQFAILLLVDIILGLGAGIVVSVSLVFTIPAFVMGNVYRRKGTARSAVTAGVIALLAAFLGIMLFGSLSGVKVMKEFETLVRDNVNTLPANVFETVQQRDQLIKMITNLLPMTLIVMSVYFAMIAHGLGRYLLRKTGETIPGLTPIREWKLPKSFVWYYVVALIVELFYRNGDPDSTLSMVLLNFLPLITIAFGIQAIGFLFFLSHWRNWGRALPILGIVLIIFLPQFFLKVFSLLGVLDVAFPIRERLTK